MVGRDGRRGKGRKEGLVSVLVAVVVMVMVIVTMDLFNKVVLLDACLALALARALSCLVLVLIQQTPIRFARRG